MNTLISKVLLVGAFVSGMVALACSANGRCRRQHSEKVLDDALDESFPASDPPASQDYAIPANRA